MKTFISSEDFQKVLELLGLPGETLHIEIGGRARAENDYSGMVLTGVSSSWALKAVIAEPGSYDESGNNLEPYSTRTVYVPVMLPGDEERNAQRLRYFEERHGPLVDRNRWSEWYELRREVVAEVGQERIDAASAELRDFEERHTEAAESPVKACLPIPYPLVTNRPSSVPPETPLAAANPGTGAYGDGPYITPETSEPEVPREW